MKSNGLKEYHKRIINLNLQKINAIIKIIKKYQRIIKQKKIK